ncbi:MHYT domain-containing protein [Nocardia sp. NPDC050406]|uniref:MHYT domain-containing protein n=1 Tax=Nocardia sp. NPDC050406 TaxID=3364318 RepID=UPI0037A432B8
MLELDHFSSGWVNPVLAYAMSVIGSALGLRAAVHARGSRHPGGWLFTAAVALGGCGIWVMHFIAMLGFSIEGARIQYDMPMTLLSAAIAIVVVWIGLSIVVRVPREAVGLPIGGAITGLGVAAMHYLGMYAMHPGAHIQYNTALVVLSVVIAVVAATAALWFMLHVRGFLNTLGSALVMGIAVCGMHYTGMAAMRAHAVDHEMSTSGADPIELITPLMLVVTVVTMTLIVVVGLAEIDSSSQRATSLPDLEAEPVNSGREWPRRDPNAGAAQRESVVSLRAFDESSNRAAVDS